jgi:hypothetical protein
VAIQWSEIPAQAVVCLRSRRPRYASRPPPRLAPLRVPSGTRYTPHAPGTGPRADAGRGREEPKRALDGPRSLTKNVIVRLRTTVVEVHGAERLEAITLFDAAAGQRETIPASVLFIFIGAVPHTECLDGVVERDRLGFILTGPDLARLDGTGTSSEAGLSSETRSGSHPASRGYSPSATCATGR